MIILTSSPISIRFTGLLTILFIGLKLIGYISWSWWWILSPLWIPLFTFIGIVLIILMIGFILILCGHDEKAYRIRDDIINLANQIKRN